ncbi:MAG: tRNA (adenosine(37)-N6)-threonylcarbamoyltransferase complex transferase subunit TsaD [Candidatus Omnitrophota bacterium]
MIVLGIETSCDETSAAVVSNGSKVLSNEVASSIKFHSKYGGIIPEIASRMQLETISEVVASALKEARVKLKDIGLISVTSGPGLSGSLLVGISFAKALSLSLKIPLLGVNHVHSHFYANLLNQRKNNIKFPFISLVASGGHTSLFYIRDFDRIHTLGQTYDDACGEAFDKVAKILGLGYPGGPEIERFALKGDPKSIKFNCSGTKGKFDFSFSGIKTAALNYLHKNTSKKRKKRDILIKDICASFQDTVIDVLIKKSFLACKLKKSRILLLGGGVVANKRLREKFLNAAGKNSLTCYFPPLAYSMDNAAMVAGLGYQLFKKGKQSNLYLNMDLS